MSIFWWTHRLTHLEFIARELTSVPVAFLSLELILLIRAVHIGEAEYQAFLHVLASPILIIINLLSFFALIFHSITWFNLAPKAMVIKIGKNPVPPFLIAGGNIGAWIVLSIIILWFFIK